MALVRTPSHPQTTAPAGPRSRHRSWAAVAGLALVGGVMASAPPGFAADRPSATGGPAAATRSAVTLVTGEHVAVSRQAGRTRAVVQRTADKGATALVSSYRIGGTTYVIPAVAKPYLGRYLDPSLFDVTSRTAATGSRVPVTLSYTGSASPSVPGVTITSAAAGHASGYLTAASAKTFGQALARQAVSDSAAGWPARSALFGSVTSMAAAGATPVVRPSFPMLTLQIKAVDHTGKPLQSAFGFIMNVEDGRKFGGFFFLDKGVARVSAPVGRYLAISTEDRFAPDGGITSWALVATDYKLSKNLQTLTLDARKATTATPSFTTPKPSYAQDLSVTLLGTDARNYASISFGMTATPPQVKLHLPPTAPPAYGTLVQQTTLAAQDPSVPGGRYRFDGGWVDQGIPAGQRHSAPALNRQALTDTTYYSDIPFRLGGTSRAVFLPGSFFVFSTLMPTPMPTHRDEYAFGPAGTLTADSTYVDPSNFEGDPGEFDAAIRRVVPGSSRTTTWLRNPIVAAVPDPVPGDFAAVLACRTGSTLAFVDPPMDGDPTHTGAVFESPDGSPVAHFTLTRNGAVLVDADDQLGAVVDVPASAATYRAVTTIDRSWVNVALSTAVTTDVTFRSSGTAGKPTPAGWSCPAGDGSRMLPVLRATTDLGGTTRGTVPVGSHRFGISVGHVLAAAQPAVTGVTVEVRRAGTSGAWASLPVTAAGSGRYAAAFTARPAQRGQVMDLRVSATDAAGGILHQTTDRAFMIGD